MNEHDTDATPDATPGANPDVPLAENPEPHEESAPEAEVVEITPATPAEIERAEFLIRQAHLLRQRGQNTEASRSLEEAAKIAPGHAATQIAVGDSYAARSRWDKARACYELAMRVDPTNREAESKYGEAVLKEKGMDEALLLHSIDGGTGVASPKAATMLSVLLPGLGQIVMGQTRKGVLVMVTWALAIIMINLMPGGFNGLMSLFGASREEFNPSVLLPCFVAVAAHMGSIFDAASQAKRAQPVRIERPVPPVDKPF